MLPNMSDTLTEWEQTVKVKSVTTTSVDFEETTVVTVENKRAVVQVAEKESLKIDSLDWSKEYKLFHSKFEIKFGDYIEVEGKDFKVISIENYGAYGYYATVGEETKKTLLVAS